ncbi:MAG: YciI family protein [Gammaproteobacteria bacterium]
MNYTLLIRETPQLFAERSDPVRRTALFAPIGAYLKALRDAGVFVSGAGLEPPAASITLLTEGRGWRAQDGPYAEAKEQLAGRSSFCRSPAIPKPCDGHSAAR